MKTTIHLVYDVEINRALQEALEQEGYYISGSDVTLEQFKDFTTLRTLRNEIIIMDAFAGVTRKQDVIELLKEIRSNMSQTRMIIQFAEEMQNDHSFTLQIINLGIYDLHFIDEFEIENIKAWINEPKSYSDFSYITKKQEVQPKNELPLENKTKQFVPPVISNPKKKNSLLTKISSVLKRNGKEATIEQTSPQLQHALNRIKEMEEEKHIDQLAEKDIKPVIEEQPVSNKEGVKEFVPVSEEIIQPLKIEKIKNEHKDSSLPITKEIKSPLELEKIQEDKDSLPSTTIKDVEQLTTELNKDENLQKHKENEYIDVMKVIEEIEKTQFNREAKMDPANQEKLIENVLIVESQEITIPKETISIKHEEPIIEDVEILKNDQESHKKEEQGIGNLAAFETVPSSTLASQISKRKNSLLAWAQGILEADRAGESVESDDLQYKSNKESKPSRIVFNDRIVGTVRIGICGIGPGKGATHASIQTALYLASLNVGKVACVELGKNNVFNTFITDEAAQLPYGFSFKDVDFYHSDSIETLLKIGNSQYKYIVIDFGSIMAVDAQQHQEYLRTDLQVMTMGGAIWDFKEFIKSWAFFEQWDFRKKWHVLVNFADGSMFEELTSVMNKKMQKEMNACLHMNRLQPDPFTLAKDVSILQGIYGNIIPNVNNKRNIFTR
ncbi:hypothetical protein [Paenibacillus agricola]|uniref:Uncharacterized protein n=1 Tax=Paenibacillus agricola TaxID=2716264 RepID=A0ABX0JLI7_9BACL|nr:hypothetical protein [Paenibacillus agricola]NHN34890.1 hypothetical protein [Paenibacillus agricola]